MYNFITKIATVGVSGAAADHRRVCQLPAVDGRRAGHGRRAHQELHHREDEHADGEQQQAEDDFFVQRARD